MKKFYTAIAIVAMAFTVQAQEALNVNGDLEAWTDGTESPEGWFFTPTELDEELVSRVEGDAAEGGNVSVKAIAGRQNISMSDIEVEAGETYTVTFWYKAETALFRFWGQWRNEEGAMSVTDDPFQISTYIEDSASEWTQMSITSTAPEGATVLRPSFRNYNGGSELYIDNVIIHLGQPTSVKDNSIEGLSIYPNPATDMVNVVSNSLSNKDIVITDLLGKTVLKANVSQSVNVSALNAGVYMMQIKQDGKTATRKLIVK
ncbi:MAG TPA: T9SS type A sorting domain-containing protein [Flavobacterium sp.]|nr:T9SS type A sorting domain-containing protein [Flavobacterium sp.]